MPGRLLAAAVAAVLLSTSCGKLPEVKQQAHQTNDGASAQALEAFLNAKQTPGFVTRDREGARLWGLVKQFYQKRGYETAWIDGRSPRPQMDELIGALQHADREGLDPSLYNASTLAARRSEASKGFLSKKGFDAVEAVSLDAWMTYLYMQYASDLANGLSDLAHADPTWKIPGQDFDPLANLSDALEHNSVARSLDDLLPHDPQYDALRKALVQYRDIASKGGWPALPTSVKLKPGQPNAVVPALARRLAVTGDFTGRVSDTETVYGPELQEAVKRFQRRHGLEPDGVIGPGLVAQMNVPADARVRQIELNLERWRWLPRDLGDRHIIVNIPEYRLEVWEHGRVPLAMRVVVGKKDTPTPIFSDEMTYLVFAPYWNVPTDIGQNETLPAVMRDPAFLERTNMEVIDTKGNPVDPESVDLSNPAGYRFRQRPGTSNSLGLVKFMFPNTFNVYLHDTPADSLFARATRSLSHGCVRLEQPEELARYVLADQPSWTPEKIQAAMHGDQETIVKLREPIPVYLGYWTARISPDGILQFRNDVYGVDGRQTQTLAERLTRLKQHSAAASVAIESKAVGKGAT
jgi:murein L,D-transpeptidase YcbB/YkuD